MWCVVWCRSYFYSVAQSIVLASNSFDVDSLSDARQKEESVEFMNAHNFELATIRQVRTPLCQIS